MNLINQLSAYFGSAILFSFCLLKTVSYKIETMWHRTYHNFFYFSNSSLLTLNRSSDIECAIPVALGVGFKFCPSSLLYGIQLLVIFSNNFSHVFLGYKVKLFPRVFSLNEFQKRKLQEHMNEDQKRWSQVEQGGGRK